MIRDLSASSLSVDKPNSDLKGHLIKLNKDIVEISSHRFFLAVCSDLKVVPRGLKCHVNLSTRKASDQLKNDFSQLNESFSLAVVDRIIQHYNEILHSLTAEYRDTMVKLGSSVSANEFQTFSDELLQRKESLSHTLQNRKLKKLHNILDFASPDKWLPALGLKQKEKS